jgi:hypothetical protein
MNIDKLFAKLLRRPCQPARTPVEQLDAWFEVGFAILQQVPPVVLDPAEVKRLGSYLFLEGPLLVHMVVAAMRRDPGFYAEDPGLAARMEASLGRAWAWGRLRGLFGHLMKVCESQRILEQGEAVRAAMGVVKDAEAQAGRRLGDSSVARERLDALEPVLVLLRQVHGRMGGRGRGKRR